ncbi:MAG: aspartate--tRNA(Asn) ligase [Candidatus Levybacteria bacterium RIFCSPLOWO2_01_FULL_39_24]|nr:MAG: aspartate--tRNA(Asn) ligase [Candidatus Levybacteria bacterium RIFCSPHIGHO2_01_FULL_40_16]OGH28514.1 MAG: aspartate--tRNA(Asn) ligase [Candidatus Levybacteria bacterium RIFCSPHIGHO2_12_FULL_39_9]OGH46288.1 MAG: aspartate--tRNA(Asn) ligase [Candidatus Levybacteria bacterium RIFCSPLOWO2_01_FULL_39_24]
MTNRIVISDAVKHVGEVIAVCGWVYLRRDHGKLIFLSLRDRSGMLQIVVNASVSQNAYEATKDVRPEFVVKIEGIVKKRPENAIDKNSPVGSVELEAKNIEILAKAETLPFDMGGKDLNLELPTLLDHRTLTLRHPSVSFIFKVQAAISEGFRKTAQSLGCTEIFVPTIVSSATEGGADVFDLNYYIHKAYLAQSPQLYKQMLVPVFERVFTIAHAYRAEPSVTTKHLSEIVQMDCEFGFSDFQTLLDYAQLVGTQTLKYAQDQCGKEFNDFGIEKISFGEIKRLKLREAQEIIFKETGRDARKEKDLSPQDEIDICKWTLKNHKSDFVAITHFPTKSKPFYTHPDPENPEYSLSYDLLFRGAEIMSGSQRINDYQRLVSAIKDRGVDLKKFEMYLQAFKYGMPLEGGFSFGLERTTMKLLNLKNIREASLFPRDMERVDERFSH